jgi:hypothetical protein
LCFKKEIARLWQHADILRCWPNRKTQVIRSGGYKRPDGKIEKPTIESLLAKDGCWVLMLDPIVKHVQQTLANFECEEVIG